MAPKHRIIIDTDPGVDDVLAILLALSASPEDLEVAMISVTYGNVPLQGCLRNAVALFHVLEKERAWRKSVGKETGFESLSVFKPIVAIGAKHPLEEEELAADHFHGADGLHGVHDAHPDLTPAETWRTLFEDAPGGAPSDIPSFSTYFTPSKTLAHKEILRILKESPDQTVTILTIGPMTNLALAAAEDPETLLRAREVCVMGGAINVPGNITPVAEFNTFADAVATARVFALTAREPASTMPPCPSPSLKPYPEGLSRQLKLSLFPLDITTDHLLNKGFFTERIAPLVASGSPLARWLEHVLSRTFDKIDSILGDGSEPGLSLHDPLTVWYMMTRDNPAWKASAGEDIRVETAGQWTRGMHILDRRVRSKPGVKQEAGQAEKTEVVDGVQLDEVPGDTMGWLSRRRGNSVNRIVGSPGFNIFAEYLMKQLFW